MQCVLKWLKKQGLLQDLARKTCIKIRVLGSMITKKGFPQRYNGLNILPNIEFVSLLLCATNINLNN